MPAKNHRPARSTTAAPASATATRATLTVHASAAYQRGLALLAMPPPTEELPLEQLRGELAALDPDHLAVINVDVTAAATVVIGALPQIREHRAALVALVGEEMLGPVDRLELYARGVLQAHAQLRVFESGQGFAPLIAVVRNQRDGLRHEVRSLIARGVLPAHLTPTPSRGPAHNKAALEALQLVAALRGRWDSIEHKTGITLADLDQTEQAANALVTAIGVRDHAQTSPAADLRARAFTLLATSYDETRRLITFLRWHKRDADRIAPSFFSGRKRRRSADATHEDAAGNAAAHVSTSVTSG